jgi:hypothetical protein
LSPSGRAARKRATLIVLALTDLMVVLDTAVVYVALPSIQRALGFSSTSERRFAVLLDGDQIEMPVQPAQVIRVGGYYPDIPLSCGDDD